MAVLVDIADLAPGGEGVGRYGDRTVFVPFTAPGDRVEVELRPGEGTAHVDPGTLHVAGPDRVDPPCPHFGPGADRGCGGCAWLHLRYERQLREKERTVVEALRRIGRLAPGSYPMRAILPSPRPLRYRSRARFHLPRGEDRLAFFRRRSHEAVRLSACQLLVTGLDLLRESTGPALARAGLRPAEVALEWSDHAARGTASLRGVDAGAASLRRCEALLEDVPELSGVVLEPAGAGRRAGPAAATVGDPVLLHERVPGHPGAGLGRSRPDVFQQANRPANALLVTVAVDWLRPDGEDVLELFCGTGNFTAPVAARARSVCAVEGQGPSLELARADLSGGNVRFFAGESLAVASALAREGRGFGALLLDPPRDGMKGMGPLLRNLSVPRVVYVSCDPATLARDVGRAVAEGFGVAGVQPVDMFPQTRHVETVVLLERR